MNVILLYSTRAIIIIQNNTLPIQREPKSFARERNVTISDKPKLVAKTDIYII